MYLFLYCALSTHDQMSLYKCSIIMLRLHYVPGGHGGGNFLKRNSPWSLNRIGPLFSAYLKLSQVEPSRPTASHGASWLAVEENELLSPGAPRRVTIRTQRIISPSRPVKVWHGCHVPLRRATVKRGRRDDFEHVCAHSIKVRYPGQ